MCPDWTGVQPGHIAPDRVLIGVGLDDAGGVSGRMQPKSHPSAVGLSGPMRGTVLPARYRPRSLSARLEQPVQVSIRFRLEIGRPQIGPNAHSRNSRRHSRAPAPVPRTVDQHASAVQTSWMVLPVMRCSITSDASRVDVGRLTRACILAILAASSPRPTLFPFLAFRNRGWG